VVLLCDLFVAKQEFPTICGFKMATHKRGKPNDWHSAKRRKMHPSVDPGVYDPSAHLQKKIDFNKKCNEQEQQEREAFRELQIYRSLKQAYYNQQIAMRDTKYPFPLLQATLQTNGPSSIRGRKQLFLHAWEMKSEFQNDSTRTEFIKKMNVRTVSVYSSVVRSTYYPGEKVGETYLEYAEDV
jgi:hypothetical protein